MTQPTLLQKLMKLPATSAVNRREVQHLLRLAKAVPENGVIVEIGSCTGRSTCALGAGSDPSVEVYAVDCWDLGTDGLMSMPLLEKTFHQNIEEMGLTEKVTAIKGFSEQVSTTWHPEKKIDLLFIDGDHSYEGALRDLQCWTPFLSKSAVVALHDVDRIDTVYRAIKQHFGKDHVKGQITQRIWTYRG